MTENKLFVNYFLLSLQKWFDIYFHRGTRNVQFELRKYVGMQNPHFSDYFAVADYLGASLGEVCGICENKNNEKFCYLWNKKNIWHLFIPLFFSYSSIFW